MPVKMAVFLSVILFLLLPTVMSCRGREGQEGRERGSGERPPQTQQAEETKETGQPAAETKDSAEAQASQNPSNRPEKTLSFGAAAETSARPAADNETDERNLKDLSRTRPFFEHAGMESRYPSDLVIGQLALSVEAGSEEEEILKLLERWILTAAGKNSADRADEFYTEESDKILRTRFSGVLFPIEKARFGKIRFDNGTARLDLRFFSEKGRAAGEAVLRLEDEEWKIQAMDVDFAALERNYIPTEYEKNPPVYGTMQM